jgi:hypothetical protein
MTGVTLPVPSPELAERQVQLKEVVTKLLVKLDPDLTDHKLAYVRVIKSPKPSILEIECKTIEG